MRQRLGGEQLTPVPHGCVKMPGAKPYKFNAPTGPPFAYLRDPDGITIQLLQAPAP